MWTQENRHRYHRSKLRYPSDLTDEEWTHVAPLIPPAKRGGGKRTVNVREGVNGLMCILGTGCRWRAIPKDLPLHDYFELWEWDRTLERIHHALYVKCREQACREPSPTAAIIDSQSVKSAEKGGPIDRHGCHAGKKTNGKKRHLLVDTEGLLLHAIVHAADIQDRDGGAPLMATLFGLFPDGGYRGPVLQKALARVPRQIDVEIVKRSERAQGFEVLPGRWIVERTIGWLNRRRRLAKVPEPQPQGPRLPQTRLHPPHAPKTLQPLMIFSDRL